MRPAKRTINTKSFGKINKAPAITTLHSFCACLHNDFIARVFIVLSSSASSFVAGLLPPPWCTFFVLSCCCCCCIAFSSGSFFFLFSSLSPMHCCRRGLNWVSHILLRIHIDNIFYVVFIIFYARPKHTHTHTEKSAIKIPNPTKTMHDLASNTMVVCRKRQPQQHCWFSIRFFIFGPLFSFHI